MANRSIPTVSDDDWMDHRDVYKTLQIRPHQAAILAQQGQLIEAKNSAGKAGVTRSSVDAYLTSMGPGNAPGLDIGKKARRGIFEGLLESIIDTFTK
jgi:hypothetical protein